MVRNLALIGFMAVVPLAPGTEAIQQPATCPASEAIRAEPPRDPNADPFRVGPWYVNGDRSIWAWAAVRMVAGPKDNKVLWIRPQRTQLTISGRRLDANAFLQRSRFPVGISQGSKRVVLRSRARVARKSR